eukprot:9961312-Alexandrium_andersonii.AAC.1
MLAQPLSPRAMASPPRAELSPPRAEASLEAPGRPPRVDASVGAPLAVARLGTKEERAAPVSYTHLTLPTICSV